MRLIDADFLKRRFLYSTMPQFKDLFDRIIDGAPTVDAVPVVRCKDCKWFNPEIEFGEIRIGTCPYQPPYEHTHGEGYCFRGVRKEDNENCN